MHIKKNYPIWNSKTFWRNVLIGKGTIGPETSIVLGLEMCEFAWIID